MATESCHDDRVKDAERRSGCDGGHRRSRRPKAPKLRCNSRSLPAMRGTGALHPERPGLWRRNQRGPIDARRRRRVGQDRSGRRRRDKYRDRGQGNRTAAALAATRATAGRFGMRFRRCAPTLCSSRGCHRLRRPRTAVNPGARHHRTGSGAEEVRGNRLICAAAQPPRCQQCGGGGDEPDAAR